MSLLNGYIGFVSILFVTPSRSISIYKPLWSELVSSLNAVDPLALMKGSNVAVTKMKFILSDPFMWDGPSMVSPCCWYSGSNSLHFFHTFVIPLDDDVNISLPSMVSIISWLCCCFSLISLMRSFIIMSCGCPFRFSCCNNTHCYFITVLFPTNSIVVFPGR